MDDQRIGRVIIILRQRRGWRQVDLAARSGVSQSAISDIERGRIDRYTLRTVRDLLRAVDGSATLDVIWGGRGDLDRLLDADHARLMQLWADSHRRAGWDVWNEASYNIYGERGRIDQLAFHPPTGVLEVTEGKTGIWDVQETLGRLDAKVRLAPRVAAERRWRIRRVVGALVLADGRTVRRRVADHGVLFARYEVRGRSARAFVRNPRRAAEGLLVFLSLPPTNHGGLRRAGQRRVRRGNAR
ncbi:MAG TPA: helix-turn-helix domain-containing protein [Candidatus Limnocylindrales bacterium]|nr:helix-turn-helix domain-containing protein [Candidatus Limnocylindrales bacterium]